MNSEDYIRTFSQGGSEPSLMTRMWGGGGDGWTLKASPATLGPG